MNTKKNINDKEILTLLKENFKFSSFKENQKTAIESILKKQDLFCVFQTGGGKSLCYQLSSLLLPGLTIVISPLIALMKDQVNSSQKKGIRSTYLNSNLNKDEINEIYSKLYNKKLDLLYLSPERLAIDGFFKFLANFEISLFVIDEAHCITDWGNSFRPDYKELVKIKKIFPNTPIAAFTATATLKIQKDIISQLKLANPKIIRGNFDRPNIKYQVLKKKSVLAQIGTLVKERKNQHGIIYRCSREATEKTAENLKKLGIKAVAYHAGLAGETREKRQSDFLNHKTKVICATIAFGMGIDTPNIRYIIHGDLPQSIEGYYQETGRAGRDGKPAEAILLFNKSDIVKSNFMIKNRANTKEQELKKDKLKKVIEYATQNGCRRNYLLNYFDEKSNKENCKNCDICLEEINEIDITKEAILFINTVAQTNERFGIKYIIEVIMGKSTDRIKKYNHNDLSCWGKGKKIKETQWFSIGNGLINQGFISKKIDQYNILKITSKGKLLLKNKTSVRITDLS